jgi:hypothetical protein
MGECRRVLLLLKIVFQQAKNDVGLYGFMPHSCTLLIIIMNQTDIISGIGVTFILLAFALTTFHKISADSKAYFILNLIGGSMAFWGSILLKSVPFTILEAIWTVVAIVGLVRSFAPAKA